MKELLFEVSRKGAMTCAFLRAIKLLLAYFFHRVGVKQMVQGLLHDLWSQLVPNLVKRESHAQALAREKYMQFFFKTSCDAPASVGED